MKTFTKTIIEKKRSMDEISEELFLFTIEREPSEKREDVLLETVQELANKIIEIRGELEK